MKPVFCRLPQLQTLPRKIPSVAFKSNHSLAHEYVPVPGPSHVYRNAHQVFDTIPDLDVVSATTIIGQFARLHQYREAIQLFSRMLFLNITPNEFTFGTVIHSSTSLGDLNLGRQFQASAMKMGLSYMVFVGSAVLDFYAKTGSSQEAQRAFEDIQHPNIVSYTTLIHGYLKKGRFEEAFELFKQMPERNIVSWNAMIGGFSQMGQNEEAVNLFVEMIREGLVPDQYTFPCAIIAAANIAALEMGRSFHACAVKTLGELSVFAGNSLISFYAKCGSMEDSLRLFYELPESTIVSWNAVICGFAQNGRGEDAVDFYERMRNTGLRPDSVTLLGLLWACNHAGLVDKGYSYLNRARLEYPSLLKPKHYACTVDLLSRHGCFKEAQEFLRDLPFNPGVGFWKALLGGCRIHSNTELGAIAGRNILDLDPKDASSYIMLSNAHSAAGRWQDASVIRQEMQERGLKRIPASSWIEIKSKIHVFVNCDRSHHQKDGIYSVLNFIYWEIDTD
uniref:DYW domain-containing protein n=1 Tax=Salix viminalis TaxID=40686 RepID=A0A6N2MSD0_SALVM